MTLIIDVLPKEVEEVRAALAAALARRRDLQRLIAEAAVAEPTYARAVDAARVAAAEAEMDWALATDENEKKLRGVRDRMRGEVSEAEDALKRAQVLPIGLARRAVEADGGILAAKAPFDAAAKPFCDYVLAEFRGLLRGSLFGSESGCMPLARVLQLGYALHDALPFAGRLRLVIAGVEVPEIGPVPGRPIPRFIQGERIWPDDDDIAGTSLRHWQDDADIVALHALLKPLGATYVEATVRIRQIEAGASAPAPPAPPEPRAVEPEPTFEEHRAIMRGYAAESTKGVTPPGRLTYSEGAARFDGVALA
jgi:hypothetical protein